MLMPPARGLATLPPKAPKNFGEMHPEAPRLGSNQRYEHLRPKPGAMLLASEREVAEVLPVDRSQSVEFRIVHGLSFLFPHDPHDLAPRPEPATERQQFPDSQVDHPVLQLAGVNRFFLLAQGVLDRLCQSLARFALVHHRDDLLLHQALFPGVLIRAVTHY